MGIYSSTFTLDQFQNGQNAATFDFNMRNNWKTLPGSWTITIQKNVRFQVRIYPGKFQLYQIQNGDLRPLLTLICVVTGKWCQIARLLLLNKWCGLQGDIYPEKFQLD